MINIVFKEKTPAQSSKTVCRCDKAELTYQKTKLFYGYFGPYCQRINCKKLRKEKENENG